MADESREKVMGEARDPGAIHTPHRMTPAVQWSHYNRYVFLLSKLLFFGIIVAVAFYLLRSLGAVLFPIFVSLMIAYLLDPGIDWLEERRVNRTLGILLYIFIGMAGLAGIVLFLYPTIARLVVSLVNKAPQLVDLVQHEQIPWLEKTLNVNFPPTIREGISEYGAQFKDAIPGVVKKAGGWLTGVVTQTGAIVSSLLNLIMIPVFSFYFLRDFDQIKKHSVVLLPAFRRDFLLARLGLMDNVVGEWFRGQLQVAGILGVLYSVGLTAVFVAVGIEWTSGIAVGIVVGVLNVIPYFGVLIGIILTALIVLIEWTGIGAVIGVGVVFVVVQLLEGYIITPKVVGEKVGLSPVTVIIVLLLGGELGGLLGILLAIPVAGALKVLLPDLIEYYQSTPFYTGAGIRPAFAGGIGMPVAAQVSIAGEDERPESADDSGQTAAEPKPKNVSAAESSLEFGVGSEPKRVTESTVAPDADASARASGESEPPGAEQKGSSPPKKTPAAEPPTKSPSPTTGSKPDETEDD